MRLLIQRSKESSVEINGKIHGHIDKGFVVLVGFTEGDNKLICDKMIDKLINLRVFEDNNGNMNLSILDVKGNILSISQFTLYADCRNGRRPSFINAMKPEPASDLYDYFNSKLKDIGFDVSTGVFGSNMSVKIHNDGPVTIYLDSNELLKKS